MENFSVHTIESAPDASRRALQGLNQSLGRIPNLAATMAESPVLINGFVGAFANFHGGSFTGAQRQVLLLTSAVTNRCPWAVAFHSTLALKEGVGAGDVQAIRQRRLPEDAQFAALSALARAAIETRGHLGADDLGGFIQAGFRRDQVLEVMAGLAVAMMANYAGNVTRPPVEQPFAAQVWTPE